MAKVHGWQLSGKLGGFVFYQKDGGCYVRMNRAPIGKKKFETDPRYASMRKNAAEFGRAGKAVRLIRTVLKQQIGTSGDGSETARLQKRMMQVLKSDQVNDWGRRTPTDGDLSLLNGFSFYDRPTSRCCGCKLQSYRSQSGKLVMKCRVKNPGYHVAQGNTIRYANLSVIVFAADFEWQRFVTNKIEAVEVDLCNQEFTQLAFDCKLEVGNNSCVFVVTYLTFFSAENIPAGSDRFDVLQLSQALKPEAFAALVRK